ncbi:MAG: hypothetical protein OHK0046_14140 [Anaerolineae bacterium]
MFFQALLFWFRHLWLSARPHRQPAAGQGLVEYALIMVFVSVVVILLLAVLGPAVSNMFTTIYESVVDSQ